MKTTTAAVAALAVALGGTTHCGRAFLASAPVRSSTGASARARSWAAAPSTCAAGGAREGAATGLSMVSATFGEKINTDKIVLDKTAREGIQEQYPEACAKCPAFLGEGFRSQEQILCACRDMHAVHVSKSCAWQLQFNWELEFCVFCRLLVCPCEFLVVWLIVPFVVYTCVSMRPSIAKWSIQIPPIFCSAVEHTYRIQ